MTITIKRRLTIFWKLMLNPDFRRKIWYAACPADPLSHPDIRHMTPRQLDDLPFPRG